MATPSKRIAFFTFLSVVFFAFNAQAGIDTDPGVLDIVLDRYQSTASTWSAVISARATWLFWLLATISMVWTFGMMALRKADIGEFFAEFIRFTVTTGFFWWLLINGPAFARSIMDGLRQMAANASGNPATLMPSSVVDIGFAIFFKVLDQSSVWSPIDSACGLLISGIILVVLALVGVNMLILLISGWILAYAGIFFLGFGGSRWTSDMAVGYFKSVLGLAAQLMTMVLLVGIGQTFVGQYYTAMNSGVSLKELGVMLVVTVVLLALVDKVPPMIGAMAGGNIQALGSGFGAGAALSAAAAGGAALAAGAANVGGGAQALMAAFSKANASESGGGSMGTGDLMAAMGGAAGGGGGGGSLASAMGDTGGGSSSMAMTDASASSQSGSGAGPTDGGSSDGGSSDGGSSDGGGSDGGGSDGGGSDGGEAAGHQDGATKDTGGSPGETAARIGRVAMGTVGNLAHGAWDAAKAKAMDRIGETPGGKIAAAIKARAGNESKPGAEAKTEPIFDGNSLSAGGEEEADAASEVAAFRDKGLSLCDSENS